MSQRRAAARLYRRALRAAARCPEPAQQRMLRDYVRIRAARERAEVDLALVKRRMEEALEEIERMEYYQAARRAEVRWWRRAAFGFGHPCDTSPLPLQGGGLRPPTALAACECGATLPPTANFCAQCGRQRAEAAS